MATTLRDWLARQPALGPLRDRALAYRERRQAYGQRLDKQAARIEALQKKVDSWTLSASRSKVEYSAAAHQITAFEERLAELEAARIDPGDDADRAEARDIVEEMRTEHARVRARLTMLGAYEERLRRVESALLHAIKLEVAPAPPEEAVGADVIEARRAGRIAPDAVTIPLRKKAASR